MRMSLKRVYEFFGIFVLLFLFLSSCGGIGKNAPDIVSEKPVNGTLSNADVRHIVVDQPYLISGDYFRERPTPKSTIDLKKIFTEGKSLEARVSKLEKKLKGEGQRSRGARLPVGPPKEEGGNLKIQTKIGLLFLEENKYLEERMENFISFVSQKEGFLLFDNSQIKELLAPTGCIKNRNIKCITKNLSLYPGIRFLVLIDRIDMGLNFPAQVRFKVDILDTGLGYGHVMLNTKRNFETQSQFDDFLKELSINIVKFAKKKKSLMGWFCRIFSSKGDKYYINAGKLSGIREGDTLRVINYGSVLYSPTGVPIAWLAGAPLGKLKVVRLVGEDVSECIGMKKGIKFKVGNYVVK